MSLYRRLIQKTLKENVTSFTGDRSKLSWRKSILEGMTTKDFKYLSSLSISDIQISSVLSNIQSTQAQDIIQASSDTTDYQFGPEFPGSYVNTIGDPITSELSADTQPQSLSSVDAQARISLGDTDNISKLQFNGDYDQDGPILPVDPWNYEPEDVTGTPGEDYDLTLYPVISSLDSYQMRVYKIYLQSGSEYVFRTLHHFPGENIPVDGIQWNPELNSGFGGWYDSVSQENIYPLANRAQDPILTLQDAGGNLVANNDDVFPGNYNQYTSWPPPTGDSWPGPGGEPYYDADYESWTTNPVYNYTKTGRPEDGRETYYDLNSKITYTPSSSGYYYLALRDFFIWNYPEEGSPPPRTIYKLTIQGTVPNLPSGEEPPPASTSSTQKTTAAYDLGAPVSALSSSYEKTVIRSLIDQRKTAQLSKLSELLKNTLNAGESVNDVLKSLNPLPARLLNYVFKTTPQEKIADAISTVGKITGLDSASNMLNTYNKFLSNPNGPGSSPSNRLDVTRQISTRDLAALTRETSGNGYISQELQKLRSGAYSGAQYNSVKETMSHLINNAVYSTIANSSGLENSLHNNVQVDMDATLKTGKITLTKSYAFRPGGSVEAAEKNPVGKVLSAMGVPLDTAGSGTGLTFYAGFAAAALGLQNSQQYGGVYKSPEMHYKIVIPSSKSTASVSTSQNRAAPSAPKPVQTSKFGSYGDLKSMFGKLGGLFKNSYEPDGQVIVEKKTLKTFTQFKEELYPGQPSPNGFPDNPPPEMANGYHPDFGKRVKWYTKMDDISAKTMSNCPTGDQEIDTIVKKQANHSTTWGRVKKRFKEG
jgi:hypothetical protein